MGLPAEPWSLWLSRKLTLACSVSLSNNASSNFSCRMSFSLTRVASSLCWDRSVSWRKIRQLQIYTGCTKCSYSKFIAKSEIEGERESQRQQGERESKGLSTLQAIWKRWYLLATLGAVKSTRGGWLTSSLWAKSSSSTSLLSYFSESSITSCWFSSCMFLRCLHSPSESASVLWIERIKIIRQEWPIKWCKHTVLCAYSEQHCEP